MLDVYQIVSENGPWIGVTAILGTALAAYIRRDWRRLDQLERRVAKLEDELREGYREIVSPCQTILASTNKLLEKFLLKD